jgi:hypothetical protein
VAEQPCLGDVMAVPVIGQNSLFPRDIPPTGLSRAAFRG